MATTATKKTSAPATKKATTVIKGAAPVAKKAAAPAVKKAVVAAPVRPIQKYDHESIANHSTKPSGLELL